MNNWLLLLLLLLFFLYVVFCPQFPFSKPSTYSIMVMPIENYVLLLLFFTRNAVYWNLINGCLNPWSMVLSHDDVRKEETEQQANGRLTLHLFFLFPRNSIHIYIIYVYWVEGLIQYHSQNFEQPALSFTWKKKIKQKTS